MLVQLLQHYFWLLTVFVIAGVVHSCLFVCVRPAEVLTPESTEKIAENKLIANRRAVTLKWHPEWKCRPQTRVMSLRMGVARPESSPLRKTSQRDSPRPSHFDRRSPGRSSSEKTTDFP